MTVTKDVTTEDLELIAALLSSPTIRDAADAAAVSESTVYRRLRDSGFRREQVLDTLNDAAKAVEALRVALPDVVTQAAEDLIRARKRVRDGQNSLWGQAKA